MYIYICVYIRHCAARHAVRVSKSLTQYSSLNTESLNILIIL